MDVDGRDFVDTATAIDEAYRAGTLRALLKELLADALGPNQGELGLTPPGSRRGDARQDPATK
jgi:hypothetical protein